RNTNGCRPFHGLRWCQGSGDLGLTPQALCCCRLRGLGALLAAILIIATNLCVVFSQSTQSIAQTKTQAADRNKYAIIINGASGDPAYAKQFNDWPGKLRSALVGKLGFAEDRVKILTEKPSGPNTAPATAEEVRKVFGALRTELNPENQLFIFLIGHGSYDK